MRTEEEEPKIAHNRAKNEQRYRQQTTGKDVDQRKRTMENRYVHTRTNENPCIHANTQTEIRLARPNSNAECRIEGQKEENKLGRTYEKDCCKKTMC